MLSTFFFVQTHTEPSLEFGPYITFEEAAKILMEYCNELVQCHIEDPPNRYTAHIVECWYRNTKRKILTIKVEEIKILQETICLTS